MVSKPASSRRLHPFPLLWGAVLLLFWVQRASATSMPYLGQASSLEFNDFSWMDIYDGRLEVVEGVREDTDVTFKFKFSAPLNLTEGDTVTIQVPRFTMGTEAGGYEDGSDLPMGQVALIPSIVWEGAWSEGPFSKFEETLDPFAESNLTARIREGRNITLLPDIEHSITIAKSNGIKAYCGFGKGSNGFKIQISSVTGNTSFIDMFDVPQLGGGCPNDCWGHGLCDYCHEACLCSEGNGDRLLDNVYPGSADHDCRDVICPAGPAWADVATQDGAAHADIECSGNGKCNRGTGECQCFDGFDGAACDRNFCPNDCSGHGRCMTIHELAQQSDAFPLSIETTYGSVASDAQEVWDSEAFVGCLCDSSWPVGLGAGETQEAEYFGPACALRHCPSGDDPATNADDTDCEGQTAPGGRGVGLAGNLCHVECSNRGVCNHDSGQCQCFAGYYGDSCGSRFFGPKPPKS